LLGTGFHQAEERVTAIAPLIGASAAGDLASRHLTTDIVFRTVGVQQNFGPLQDRQQVVFLSVQPRKQPVERGKACCG